MVVMTAHKTHKSSFVLREALRFSGLQVKYKKIVFLSSNLIKNITYKKVVSASRSMLRIGIHAAFLVGCVMLVV